MFLSECCHLHLFLFGTKWAGSAGPFTFDLFSPQTHTGRIITSHEQRLLISLACACVFVRHSLWGVWLVHGRCTVVFFLETFLDKGTVFLLICYVSQRFCGQVTWKQSPTLTYVTCCPSQVSVTRSLHISSSVLSINRYLYLHFMHYKLCSNDTVHCSVPCVYFLHQINLKLVTDKLQINRFSIWFRFVLYLVPHIKYMFYKICFYKQTNKKQNKTQKQKQNHRSRPCCE